MPRKTRKSISGRFIPLTHELIDSPAWKDLSPTDKVIYIQIYRQYNGRNDHDLKLPYSQMDFAPATISKSLRHLVDVGLIDIIKQGGLFKNCSIYGLSTRWKIYKRPPLMARSIEMFRK